MPYYKPARDNGADVDGTTVDELRKEVYREPHDPNIPPPTEKHEFESTQIVAFLNEIKQNRKGDVIVSIMVPYRYRWFALPLGDAYGIPLSIDVQRWQLYDNARTAAAGEERGD